MDAIKSFLNTDYVKILMLLGPGYHSYYEYLMQEGFTKQQALELAIEYKAETNKKRSYQEEI